MTFKEQHQNLYYLIFKLVQWEVLFFIYAKTINIQEVLSYTLYIE
jgi:hypothetical protein